MLAGCGGSRWQRLPAPAGASSSATASAGLGAFQTCLKQHGVKGTPGQGQPGARPTGSFSPGASADRRPADRIAAPARVLRRPEFGRVQGLR